MKEIKKLRQKGKCTICGNEDMLFVETNKCEKCTGNWVKDDDVDRPFFSHSRKPVERLTKREKIAWGSLSRG